MNEHIIQVDPGKCIGCGLCAEDCPVNNFTLKGKKAVIRDQGCMKCGHCAAICPKAAVTISGFEDKPEDLIQGETLDSERLLRAIKSRRSIRRFKPEAVPQDAIHRIIEAGRFTPTAKNAQDLSYIVLSNGMKEAEGAAVHFFKKLKPFAGPFVKGAKGMDIDDDFFFKKAPAAIVVLSKDPVSASLAASNMALMAESLGLGVLYSGFFTIAANYSGKVRRSLGMERRDKAVTTLVLGYPDVSYRRTVQREAAVVRRI